MTITLIVGNAFFAILCAIFWNKYSKLKQSSETEISELKQELDESQREINSAAIKMRENLNPNNQNNDVLVQELADLRKEKEVELKLRMEAEKQIAIAIQKTEDIQKRMIDWKVAQEAAMKDSQAAIFKIGEDLYQKINTSHQNEIENNQNIFSQILEHLTNNNDTSIQQTQTLTTETQERDNTDSTPINQDPPENNLEQDSEPKPEQKTTSANTADKARDMISHLEDSMQNSEYENGKDYFFSSSFEADKSKLFLCESAFIQDAHLYIFDFKSCNFLEDYLSNDNKEAALEGVTKKLDKYISYLSNPKYRAAILKAMASKNVAFDNGDIVVVTPSNQVLETLEEIGYLEKLEDAGAKVATFDEILDLTL